MKHQQVVIDYWSMLKTSCTCLLLAFSGYVFIKMVQTMFWLPRYLQANKDLIEGLAKKYSIPTEDVEDIENALQEGNDDNSDKIENNNETIPEPSENKKEL